jgi:hypothetical protein
MFYLIQVKECLIKFFRRGFRNTAFFTKRIFEMLFILHLNPILSIVLFGVKRPQFLIDIGT